MSLTKDCKVLYIHKFHSKPSSVLSLDALLLLSCFKLNEREIFCTINMKLVPPASRLSLAERLKTSLKVRKFVYQQL